MDTYSNVNIAAGVYFISILGIRPNTQSFVSKCKSNEDKLQHTTRTNRKYICLYICCYITNTNKRVVCMHSNIF